MIEVTTINKKAPQRRAFKRPGEPIRTNPIVSAGPDGRVVREVFLPNTRGDIEPGPFGETVVLPEGCAVVLYVGDGNRMSWETARTVGKSLALCSFIQVQGEGLGPNRIDAHYLWGLEAILHGIRTSASEEAEHLRDWEVTA